MRSTQIVPRRFGRKVKNWSASPLACNEQQPFGDRDETSTRLGENEMLHQTSLAGSFALPGTSMTVSRMGYGAMQLAGAQVWGPPRDVDAAIAVLRERSEEHTSELQSRPH